jgi:hypothetical protein
VPFNPGFLSGEGFYTEKLHYQAGAGKKESVSLCRNAYLCGKITLQ